MSHTVLTFAKTLVCYQVREFSANSNMSHQIQMTPKIMYTGKQLFILKQVQLQKIIFLVLQLSYKFEI